MKTLTKAGKDGDKRGGRRAGKKSVRGNAKGSRAPGTQYDNLALGSGSEADRIPGDVPGSLARQRIDIAQPYQEQRVDAGIPCEVGPNKGVYVQPFNAKSYGKSGFIGQLELNARRKLGNRGF